MTTTNLTLREVILSAQITEANRRALYLEWAALVMVAEAAQLDAPEALEAALDSLAAAREAFSAR